MTQRKESKKESAVENFGKMIRAFGDAVGELFSDPSLKEKAREFGKAAAESAEAFASKFEDKDVRARFQNVGQAAQEFGKSVTDYFKTDKETDITGPGDRES